MIAFLCTTSLLIKTSLPELAVTSWKARNCFSIMDGIMKKTKMKMILICSLNLDNVFMLMTLVVVLVAPIAQKTIILLMLKFKCYLELIHLFFKLIAY